MGDNLERQFTETMAAYRAACGSPESSANFMPNLWQRIESHRRSAFPWRFWARRFVTAAAAICLVLGAVLVTPVPQNNTTISLAAYLEALADENDTLAYSDVHTETDADGQGYVGSQGYME